VKQQCWEKAEKIPGRDPERWRRDALGNIVFRKLVGCPGCLCHDYDHILPYSKVWVPNSQDSNFRPASENCLLDRSAIHRVLPFLVCCITGPFDLTGWEEHIGELPGFTGTDSLPDHSSIRCLHENVLY
jgi:hypothetical protein